MGKRIAEVSVVADLDTTKYNAELKALTAKTIAELDAIGREKVRVNIDIEKNELDREILAVKKKLNELSKIKKGEDGYQQAKANTKQFETYLKDLQLQMLENRQAAKELALAFKILGISEKEHADQLKRLKNAVGDHSDAVRDSTSAHHDHEDAVTSDSAAMGKYRSVLNGAQRALKFMGDEQTKFNKVWRFFTNSKTPVDTIKKLGREGVRIGPFNATIKGLISAFTFLGPIVNSVGLSLSSFVGVAAGATAGLGALGTALIGGLGQGFLGIKFAMRPVVDEFKVLKQTSDAYNKAVMKYGEGSKQAKKAQEQMNNALKTASPLAREASKSLQQAQLIFSKMTGPTRNSMSLMLADAMKTMKQMAPSFAADTNTFAGGLQRGMSGFMGQLRADSKQENGGAFGTMFKNSAQAIQPLIGAIGNLTMALARVGASASRHLTPMMEGFKRWSGTILNATGSTSTLNRRVDSLMSDLKSVGRLFLEAGRWARSFFGASREAGRTLTDSLAATFKQWNDSISSDSGRKQLSDWFMEAAGLVTNLVNTFRPLVNATSRWAEALTPLTSTVFAVTASLAQLFGWIVRLPVVSQVFQAFALGAGIMFTLSAASTFLLGSFTRLGGGLLIAGASLMRWINTSNLVMTALMGINSVAPRAATALLAIGTSSTLALGAFGLLVAGIAGLAYGLSSLASYNRMDDLKAKSDAATQALERARLKVQELNDSLQGKVDAMFYAQANKRAAEEEVRAAKAQLNAAKERGDKQGIIDATQRLTEAEERRRMANRDASQAARDMAKEEAAALKAATAAVEEAGNKLTTQQDMIDRSGLNFDAITASTDEYNKKLEELQANIMDAEYQKTNPLGLPPEERQSEDALDRQIAQWKEQIGLIEAARQARQKFSQTELGKAAQPAINARIKAKFDVSDTNLQSELGKLASVNERIAIRVATTVEDPAEAARVASVAAAALQAGADSSQVLQAISADPTQALSVLGQLLAQIKAPAATPLGLNPDLSNYWSLVSQVTQPLFAPLRILGSRAEGGPVSAASGYTVETAAGSASRRPTRNIKSGGRINEPTLLVGEENRREYVIATNPAYRAQNKRYLAAAASDLGMTVVESAAGGRRPTWRQRKVMLNAIFNPSLNDKKRKPFSRDVRNTASNIKGLEDWADALSKMMDNDEKRNQPNAWKRHRKARDKTLRQILAAYRRALPVAGKNNKRALRNMIAGVEGDLLDLKADSFDGVSLKSKSAEELRQATIDKQAKELSTLRASLASEQAFNMVSGGMLAESFAGPLASGGPGGGSRRSAKGVTQIININALDVTPPEVATRIGNAAATGFGYQGSTPSPRMAVGV